MGGLSNGGKSAKFDSKLTRKNGDSEFELGTSSGKSYTKGHSKGRTKYNSKWKSKWNSIRNNCCIS